MMDGLSVNDYIRRNIIWLESVRESKDYKTVDRLKAADMLYWELDNIQHREDRVREREEDKENKKD